MASLANIASSALIDPSSNPGRWGTAHPSIVPYQGFRTRDGMIMIGAGNDRQFGILCESIQRVDLISNAKFLTNSLRVENRAELQYLIENETEKKTTEEWLAIFEGKGIPYAAVKYAPCECSLHSDVQETLRNLQIEARETVKTIRHTTCGKIRVVGPPVKLSVSSPSIRLAPPVFPAATPLT